MTRREAGFSLAINKVKTRMFDNIPDWIEIVVGLFTTQVPILWSRLRSRPQKRQRESRLHIKIGSFEWKSHRRDDDQS